MPVLLPSTGTPGRNLPRFLLASVALHGLAVLALWHAPAHLGGQPDTVLSVTLGPATVTPAPASARSQAGPVAEASPARPPHATTVATATTATLATGRFVPDASRASGTTSAGLPTGAPPTDGAGIAAATAAARIRTRLLTDLARYFEYPVLARLRGWQGTVVVGVRVEPDGQLDKIELARSSGHALLDEAALDSLRRVDRLADASTWLNGRSLDMQLPVIYRLLDR